MRIYFSHIQFFVGSFSVSGENFHWNRRIFKRVAIYHTKRISSYSSISHNKKMCTISIRFGELWVEKFNLMFNSNSHPFFIFNFSAIYTYIHIEEARKKGRRMARSFYSFFFSIYMIMLSECDFYSEIVWTRGFFFSIFSFIFSSF